MSTERHTNKCKKTLAVYTLGCKVNQYESNGILQKFKEKGYEIVNFEDYADIYIVNTCTVTNESDRKCRQIIRRAKQQNKNAVLIVVGCYVNVAREELEKIEEIDLILDNSEKSKIAEILCNRDGPFLHKYVQRGHS